MKTLATTHWITLALLGGMLCASPRLEAVGPGQMPALVLEQFVEGQWESPGNHLVTWGNNSYGNTTLSGVVAISAGENYTVALKKNGTVVAWGRNDYGQTKVPAGLSRVVAIAAGGYHTVALKSDGTVVGWGVNHTNQTTVPTGLSGVIAIAAGYQHSVALKNNGTVVAWGANYSGETSVPTDLSDVVAVAAGIYHTVALKRDGTVVAWGYNGSGQTNVPTGLSDVVSIAAGGSHTVALQRNGKVIAWGYNGHGETNVPTGLSDVVAIAAGGGHTVALKNNCSVVAWGFNGNSQIPADLSGVVAVAAGSDHTVALTSIVEIENPVTGSDSNITLRLTNPSTSNSFTGLRLDLPTSTEGQFNLASQLPTTLSPGASLQFTISYTTRTRTATSGMLQAFANGSALPLAATALRVDNAQLTLMDEAGQAVTDEGHRRVVAWGNRFWRQNTVPAGISGVVAIAAGNYNTVALKSDGRVIAWGDSTNTVPAGLTSVVAIAAGAYHTVALKSDGRVVAWGYNGQGQTRVPAGLSSVAAIAAGGAHTVALKSDGRVVAWGYNGQGQTRVPAGLHNVVAIAAGSAHTLALKGDGTVVAWGHNSSGQTTVPAFLSNVVAIAAGSYHNVALASSGILIAWGNDVDGQTRVPLGLSGVVAIAAGADHSVALIEALNNFPPIQLGSYRDHTLYIKDTGAIALTGISVVIEGPDADQFSVPYLPATHIAVGEQSPFTLRFTPTRLGSLNATLKIYSNDPDSPLRLPIRGTGNFITATQSNSGNSIFTSAPLRLERATGLMLQKISFTNTTGVSLQGLRLLLSNLASGVTLYSSSAGKAPGTFEVLYTKAIAPGETVTFDLVYHDPKRRTTASIQPVIKAQALEEAVPTPGPVTGTTVPLLRVQKLPQGPALEWNAKAGSTYVVEYSDDAGKTWFSAVHRLTSRGTRLFWIDRGQPETFSKPVIGTRTYRVKLL